MATGPCTICGSQVRIAQREMPRRLGDTTAEMIDVRVCTSASCDSNTGTRRLGEAV